MKVDRRFSAIMFADIVRSSEIIVDQQKHAIRQVLDRHLALSRGYDSHLFSKQLGDGILVCLSVCSDLAELALNMQHDFKTTDWRRRGFQQEVKIRVGLDFQTVTLQLNAGGEVTDGYSAGLDRASRVEPITHADCVFCTELFYKGLCSERVANIVGHSLGPVDLAKGAGREILYSLAWSHENAKGAMPSSPSGANIARPVAIPKGDGDIHVSTPGFDARRMPSGGVGEEPTIVAPPAPSRPAARPPFPTKGRSPVPTDLKPNYLSQNLSLDSESLRRTIPLNLTEAYNIQFTSQCDDQLSKLNISRNELIDLLQQEFISHINYFRFDLEDYIMPIKAKFLLYLDKVESHLQFKAIYPCSNNEAKLSSWNDVLTLYRRATRLPYRQDPNAILLQRGLLNLALRVHFEAEQRIIKHFKVFEHLAIGSTMSELFDPEWHHPDNVKLWTEALGLTEWGPEAEVRLSMLKELSLHLKESAGARKEAETIAKDYRSGILSVESTVGPIFTALERSLQHIHKILLRYMPSS